MPDPDANRTPPMEDHPVQGEWQQPPPELDLGEEEAFDLQEMEVISFSELWERAASRRTQTRQQSTQPISDIELDENEVFDLLVKQPVPIEDLPRWIQLRHTLRKELGEPQNVLDQFR